MTIVRTRGNTAKVAIAAEGQHLEDVIAGTNITIDKSDPLNPVISSTGGGSISGSGTTNQIAYWTSSTALGSLTTATYPSLTELSYVKGVTSAIQTQLNAKLSSLSNGNGTTANGSAVDLGGTQSGNISIIPDGDNTRSLTFGDNTHNLLAFNVWGNAYFKGYAEFTEFVQVNNSLNVTGDETQDLTATFTDGGDNTVFNLQHTQILFSHRSGRTLLFNNTGVQLNLGSDAIGDTYQRNASGYLSRLASVSAGSFLRSGGVATVSAWSTVKLPDTMSALGLWVANSANTTVNLTAAANQSIRVNSGGTAWEAYTPASGGWALTGTSTLTGAVDIVGSSSNTIKHTFDSLGTTQTDGAGLHFRNTTAAAAGAQQISPSIVLEGQGWKTNATAASQSVKFAQYVLPVQGAANPTGTWTLASSINGAAYGNSMTYTSDGLLTLPNLTLSGGSLTISSSRIIAFNGGLGTIAGDANAGLAFRSNASSTVPTGGYYRFFNTYGSYSATSGTLNIMANETSFAPTSGTAVFNAFLGSGTINQTGGANGAVSMINLSPTYTAAVTVYGIRYNPTVTSVTNHYFINASSGRVLLGGLPTSSAGLSTGELWNNSGVINIV